MIGVGIDVGGTFLNDKVSLKSAREDYQIIFNENHTMNEEKTTVLRGRGEGSV